MKTKVLYARTNLRRKPEFQIGTIIMKKFGASGKTPLLFVRKYATSTVAQKKLQELLVNYEVLKQQAPQLQLPRILSKKKEHIDFEFLQGASLEKKIEQAILTHNFEVTNTVIREYLELVSLLSQPTHLYYTQDFVAMFDPEKKYLTEEKLDVIVPGLFDLNPDNVIYENGKYFFIDYEWVLPFALPRDFVLYRAIFFLSMKLQSLIQTFATKNFPVQEVFPAFFIPVSWLKAIDFSFPKMEKYLHFDTNFQKRIALVSSEFLPQKGSQKVYTQRISPSLEKHLQKYQETHQALHQTMFKYQAEQERYALLEKHAHDLELLNQKLSRGILNRVSGKLQRVKQILRQKFLQK